MTPTAPAFPPFPGLATDSVHDALAWHDRISAGISLAQARDTAAQLSIPAKVFSVGVLGTSAAPRGKDRTLRLSEANAFYRLLQVLDGLKASFGGDLDKGFAWLTAPSTALRGRVPLDLMATPMGMEYLRTALERKMR